MAQRDLVVSFLSSVPPTVELLYQSRPLQLVSPVTQVASGGWPGGRAGYSQWIAQFRDAGGNVIPGMFRAAGGQPGDTIGRVAVMGFSNGCIGVDETLGAADSHKIDTVLAIDGIHGRFAPGSREPDPIAYKNFLNHAAQVLQHNPSFDENAPVMCITHSSIVPPDFPSTTQTADLIWSLAFSRAPEDVLTLECGFDCPPVRYVEDLAAVRWPDGQQVCSSVTKKCYSWSGLADGWYDRRVANDLFVLGWGDRGDKGITTRDPSGNADHVFQGRVVLREMLKELTAKRWNADCGIIASVAGFGQDDMIGCRPGHGLDYDRAEGGKVDYFPELGPSTPPSPRCPEPPPGYVIVGAPGDPCRAMAAPPAPAPSLLTRSFWAGAGMLGGYATLRYVARRW